MLVSYTQRVEVDYKYICSLEMRCEIHLKSDGLYLNVNEM